jgi:Mn2+/Fe2+ NRAMP family transporter
VTGAADDDPSGIGAYAQVGAAFGFGLLWTTLATLPPAIAVQEATARLGLVTGKGLAALLRERFPRPVLLGAATLVAVANTFNIGADIASMAAAAGLLVPVPQILAAVGFALVMVVLQVTMPYHRYARVLRWLALSLLAYVGVLAVVHVDWSAVLAHTLVPGFSADRAGVAALLAVFGTTTSPYLFFWQAAEALRPLAGGLAGLLFAAGIVGAGLLAVPVLAGSTAYAIAESVGWPEGLSRRARQARALYAVIAISILLGAAMNLIGISPIRALYLAAILNGVAAPPLLMLIALLGRSGDVLGRHRSGPLSQLLVGAAAVIMAVLAVLAALL